MQLGCEVGRPGFGKPGIFLELGTNRGPRDRVRAGPKGRNAVAVIALREQRCLGEYRPRSGSLKTERGTVLLVTNEVRFTVRDEVDLSDPTTPMEDAFPGLKLAFDGKKVETRSFER